MTSEYDDVDEDGEVDGHIVSTHLHHVEYVTRDERGFLSVVFDNGGLNGEIRLPISAFEKMGWVIPPFVADPPLCEHFDLSDDGRGQTYCQSNASDDTRLCEAHQGSETREPRRRL